MTKLHHFVIEHPTWFSANRPGLRQTFLADLSVKLQDWALAKVEHDTVEEIRDLQLRRLRRLVRYAYANVPFWRQRMDEAGFDPQDLQCIEDLAKLPVTSKVDLKRESPERLVSGRIRQDYHYASTTSGTTGVPLRVLRDGRGTERYQAIRSRAFRWTVGKRQKGDRYIKMIPVRNMPHVGSMPQRIPVRMESVDTAKQQLLDLCADGNCIVQAYPSFIARVAHLVEKERGTFPLKGIITSAEKMETGTAEYLRKVFQAPLGERYTSIEGSRTIAQTCRMGRYHINEDQVLVELIRTPDMPAGVGKVLITDLNNFLMPFIRYENGDLGSFDGAPCPCGSPFRSITFEGRASTVFHLPDGRIMHPFRITEVLGTQRRWVERYQVVRRNKGIFEVLLVTMNTWGNMEIERLRTDLEKLLGEGICVEVKVVPDLEDPLGKKFKSFISLVSENGAPPQTTAVQCT